MLITVRPRVKGSGALPYSCEWIVPGRVSYGRTGEVLSAADVAAFSRAGSNMVGESGIPPVYFIGDLRALRHAPVNLAQLRRVLTERHAHDIACYIIIVQQPIYGFMAAALVKLMHRPVQIVHDEAGALAALRALEPELVVSLHG